MTEGNGLRVPFVTPQSDKHSQWPPLGQHLRRHPWKSAELTLAVFLRKARRGSVAVSQRTILILGFCRIPLLLPGQGSTLALRPSLPPTPPQAWLREEWAPCFYQLTLSGCLWWQELWHLHAPPQRSVGRPQAITHQELGLDQMQPKSLSLTSPGHLVWFHLLKKRPFSQFGLTLKHLGPGGCDKLLLRYIWSQSTRSTSMTASAMNRPVPRFKPQRLLANWVALGKIPASLVLHFFISKMEVTVMMTMTTMMMWCLFHRVVILNEIRQEKHLAVSSNIDISQSSITKFSFSAPMSLLYSVVHSMCFVHFANY